MLGSFSHGAVHEPWAENARPFGLAYGQGWLYHGVVNTRAQDPPIGELVAHVYRSRADGAEMSLVARFGLDYPRDPPWQDWTDAVPRSGLRQDVPAQAILTDIALRENGDLLIGLRDRTAEVMRESGHPMNHMGDLIPLRNESSGMRAVTEPEFYDDETIVDEATQGTMAMLPGRDVVVSASSVDSKFKHPSGMLWYDNTTGEPVGRETIVDRLTTQGWVRTVSDVEVLCRKESPPPTRSPTPTRTATAPIETATPTHIPTQPTPTTPSATRVPRPLFLPLARHESCEPHQLYADVALVLDVSTSMLRVTTAGRHKIEAVQDAAGAFLSLVDFTPDKYGGHDQVAIIAFNDTAWIRQSLTATPNLLRGAIGSLSDAIAEGTRHDLALVRGIEAMQDPGRRHENTPVLILLTDGLPNRVPTPVPSGTQEDTIVALALQAKNLGFRIYAIGVGTPGAPDPADRINPGLLRAVASEPNMYYQTPDAEGLERIYAEIAQVIGCP